jgi:hypothetical protein
VTSPLSLIRSATYWLGGEPNNFVDPANNQDEDCIEFSNLANKKHHAEFTGITTGQLGRMNDINCTTQSRFLCRNVSDITAAKWLVSAFTGTYAQANRACPQGYAFSVPLSETEVKEASAVVDTDPALLNIWVNMNDRAKEGDFIVPVPSP